MAAAHLCIEVNSHCPQRLHQETRACSRNLSINVRVLSRLFVTLKLRSCVLGDDYQERFGKFVPDSDNATWFARRESEHAALCASRELLGVWFGSPTHLLCSLQLSTVEDSPFEDGVKLQAYFDKGTLSVVHSSLILTISTEDAFATEFGITFKGNDGHDTTFDMKRRLLYHYKRLLQRAKGDVHVAARIAGTNYLLTVTNPFQVTDDRRMELDFKRTYLFIIPLFWCSTSSLAVRHWAAMLRGVDVATLKPTFADIEFRFELPNRFQSGDERRLHYWCYRA